MAAGHNFIVWFYIMICLNMPVLSGCKTKLAKQPAANGEVKMKFQLTSSAFENNQRIPVQYTGQGKDINPPLKWANAPAETKSFAVISDDPDAPGRTWVHWVYFNIPADKTELPEGIKNLKQLPDGSRQGITDFGSIGYGGPMPPPGSVHRYFFKIYALDAMLDLQPGISKDRLLKAMNGHILAEAQLVGTYSRN